MNLNNHHGESSSSRADKMSGHDKVKLKERKDKKKLSKKVNVKISVDVQVDKKFYSRKRRMFLKNPKNWDKI